MRPARDKRCARCGTVFLCGPAAGKTKCWCDELPPVGPLAGAQHDCLCPSCLSAGIARLEADRKPLAKEGGVATV